MERNRLIELAIAELERQKAGIDQDLKALRAELAGKGSAARQKELAPSAVTLERRSRTLVQRRAQAKRMKAYWAKKKAGKVSEAKAPAAGAKARAWTDAKKKALSLKMRQVWKKRKAAEE
jgi:hypothetical protein